MKHSQTDLFSTVNFLIQFFIIGLLWISQQLNVEATYQNIFPCLCIYILNESLLRRLKFSMNEIITVT